MVLELYCRLPLRPAITPFISPFFIFFYFFNGGPPKGLEASSYCIQWVYKSFTKDPIKREITHRSLESAERTLLKDGKLQFSPSLSPPSSRKSSLPLPNTVAGTSPLASMPTWTTATADFKKGLTSEVEQVLEHTSNKKGLILAKDFIRSPWTVEDMLENLKASSLHNRHEPPSAAAPHPPSTTMATGKTNRDATKKEAKAAKIRRRHPLIIGPPSELQFLPRTRGGRTRRLWRLRIQPTTLFTEFLVSSRTATSGSDLQSSAARIKTTRQRKIRPERPRTFLPAQGRQPA